MHKQTKIHIENSTYCIFLKALFVVHERLMLKEQSYFCFALSITAKYFTYHIRTQFTLYGRFNKI